MADPGRLKTIKIKTGVVKRLTKETTMYEKEADQQKGKIEKMKKEGVDEYNIRKQEEVLQESLMMIPDCQKRLRLAFSELRDLVLSEKDLEGTDEFTQAQLIVSETIPLLKP